MIPLVLSFPCMNSWRELFLYECLLYIQSGFETDLTELPKKTSELIWAQFFLRKILSLTGVVLQLYFIFLHCINSSLFICD